MNSRKSRSQRRQGIAKKVSKPLQKPPNVSFSRRTGIWMAGILTAALAAASGTWLTGLSGKAAGAFHLSSGPVLTATADVLFESNQYALTTPVTTIADRVTLQNGTATGEAIMALISRHGGVAVGLLNVTLVLQGHRDGLRIIDINPQILGRHLPAPKAAYLVVPRQGTEPIQAVTADTDLTFPELESGGVPYFSKYEVSLADGESESFQISFTAATGFRIFNLIITYLFEGKQYQQTVPGPDNGAFEIAGLARDYDYYGTIYWGPSWNQFEVASTAQACQMFPRSRGC
jgi:hypothetical protein